MRNILRGSTVVSFVRQSQTARLYARFRDGVTRRLDRADAPHTSESDGGGSSQSETTERAPTSSSSLLAGSLLFALFATFGTWIRASWLYRWLTAEPDPDVIVIDLRETLTVGPVLAVIDWFGTRLAAIGGHASSVRLGRLSIRLLASRPVQVASALLGSIALALAGRIALSPTASTPLVVSTVLLAICALFGSRNSQSWAELKQTRPVRLLAAAFEPPEPPERHDETNDPGSSEDDR